MPDAQDLIVRARVFQERAALHRRLAEQAIRRGLEDLTDRFEDRAREEEQRAGTIRQLVARGTTAFDPLQVHESPSLMQPGNGGP